MKGIILAGGNGTRLSPITVGVSKQLIPVYDKPLVYYPLSILMLAYIKDILIITKSDDQSNFKRLLGDGSKFGIHISYAIQDYPNGLVEAFIIGKEFIGDDCCAMILGDNVFYGNDLKKILQQAKIDASNGKATIFGCEVNSPERFGIIEFDENGKAVKLIEKPKNPKSNYAITGLYFYPKGVCEQAAKVTPSERGELEITTLNNLYLQEDNLKVQLLGGGYTWFDAGTFDSLLDAGQYIKSVEKNKGRIVACLEQIAYDNKWITKTELKKSADLLMNNQYGSFLKKVGGKITDENN